MPRKKRKQKRAKPSETEQVLRRHLANKFKIQDEDDDLGLHDWIASMDSTTNDARSAWEAGVQKRLAAELGL